KLRRQFIGSATHDLKNPLFVISGYSDMLEMSPEVSGNEQLMSFVESIQRGVDKMSELVHDILDLLQLETEVTLNKTPIDFALLLEHSTKDMHLRASEKKQKLTVHPPDKKIDVSVDFQRMIRVLENLISNA